MDRKPATIKEIASRLNVSVSTVSRALHNHPSIGLRTRMEVQKLARELNYEPNQTAISFKQGKTMTIGVILPNLGEQFFSIAINGIEEVAISANYTVLIGQSHDDLGREKQIVETMKRHRVDGILVSLSKNTNDLSHFQQLKSYKIPVVFFDRVPLQEEIYSVTCDLRASSIQLVDWLVNKGHRRIGFIKGPDTLHPSLERLEGFLKGLEKNGLERNESYLVQTDLSKGETQKAMESLLLLEKPPTAVIAFNDYVALDAMKYSRQKGYAINKDIWFASYANLPITTYLDNPPIASVEQFPFQQAEKAARTLFQLIQGNEVLHRKTILESKVVINDTFKKAGRFYE